ncbi:MAG: PA2778 family cysteine peptidase [Bacteriovorax sp.]|nr:PA2778 family cysteine peptidase [Bacteriovorax sp.]
MSLFRFLLLALLFTGCATRGEKLRTEFLITPDQKILDIPFIAQTDYHCGPAALAMVSNSLGVETTSEELSSMLYTPQAKGTFQNDLMAATRRLGFIAVPVKDIKQIFDEINNGNPILIFQNLGLSWIPKWHYALVVGYDLNQNEMILHSGETKNYRIKISTFESTWKRVDNWGLIIVRPGSIPKTASEIDMIKASARLETTGHMNNAKISYEKILEKWPESLGSQIGLGNIYYQLNDYEKSSFHLKQATDSHPNASGAWYNYAIVLMTMKKKEEAHFAAKKALETTDPAAAKIYKVGLKNLLD